MKQTPGHLAYIEDVRRKPAYHDGTPRRTWSQLPDWMRATWERNPTARNW